MLRLAYEALRIIRLWLKCWWIVVLWNQLSSSFAVLDEFTVTTAKEFWPLKASWWPFLTARDKTVISSLTGCNSAAWVSIYIWFRLSNSFNSGDSFKHFKQIQADWKNVKKCTSLHFFFNFKICLSCEFSIIPS